MHLCQRYVCICTEFGVRSTQLDRAVQVAERASVLQQGCCFLRSEQILTESARGERGEP